MGAKWIVVINRVEARVYDSDDMRKVCALRNPAGRERNRAFTSDRPFLGSRGPSKSLTHNVSNEKTPHDEVAKMFAKKICLYLKKKFGEQRFDKLILVAEPRMQGWVKGSIDKNLERCVTWQSGDFGKLSDYELKIRFLGKGAVWPHAVIS